MIRNKRLLIILVVLIIMMIGLVYYIAGAKIENAQVTTSQADISFLKQSEFANKDFQKVEIGDTFEEVESRMGTLTKIESDSEYDVYEFIDETTRYNFFFKDQLLENVSMYAV